MSLLSLAYVLLDKPMQRRFEADPMLRAADLLLQERVPKAVRAGLPARRRSPSRTQRLRPKKQATMRVFTDPERARCPKSICFPTAGTTS